MARSTKSLSENFVLYRVFHTTDASRWIPGDAYLTQIEAEAHARAWLANGAAGARVYSEESSLVFRVTQQPTLPGIANDNK